MLRRVHNRLRFSLGLRDGLPAVPDARDPSRHARTFVDVEGAVCPQLLQVLPGESVADALSGFVARTGYQLDPTAADRAALRLLLAAQPPLPPPPTPHELPLHFDCDGGARAIVVARYREDVRWLAADPAVARDVWLYDKGGDDWRPPRAVTRAFRVHLPQANVGREAHSYLRFIVDHYADLPALVVFAQARVDDHLGQREWAALLRGRQRPLDAWDGWALGLPQWPPGEAQQRVRLAKPFSLNASGGGDAAALSTADWWAATLQPLLLQRGLGGGPAAPRIPALPPVGGGAVPVAWGAIFCATRVQLRSVPLAAYALMLEQASAGPNPEVAYFLERAWVHLLGASDCSLPDRLLVPAK